jgi:acyl carrier protein
MTEASGVRDRVAKLFSRGMSIEVPSVDTDLFDTGVLDSLAFVELLLQLEREFGVKTCVDDLEVENFNSIARIADFVMARARIAPGAPTQPATAEFGPTSHQLDGRTHP